MKVSVGHYVRFRCSSWGIKLWFWKSPNKTIHSLDSMVLTINSVSIKDTGYYHCFGSYKGNAKHFIATGHLKVYGESISSLIILFVCTKCTHPFVGAMIDRKTKLPINVACIYMC